MALGSIRRNPYGVITRSFGTLHRSIILHICQEIRDNANMPLLSYSVYDDDWGEVKGVLAVHYVDKRDIRALESNDPKVALEKLHGGE